MVKNELSNLYILPDLLYYMHILFYCSTEDSLHTKPSDDTRHVTITVTDTSEDDVSASSGGKQIHPDPDGARSPSEEQGSWPLKRSHR